MKKTVFKTAAAAALTLLLCMSGAYAKEATLIDLPMKNLFATDKVNETSWGKLYDSPAYVAGKKWASEWGFAGWGEDYEDMLKIYGLKNAASGQEGYIYHAVNTDKLPDNATVTMSMDIITGPQHSTDDSEIWFRMQSKPDKEGASSVTVQPFRLRSAPGGITAEFASTTGWPFTAKDFDRTTGITLEYDTPYTINCTMSPTESGHYRFLTEVYKNGTKVGAGIVEQYDRVSADTFNVFENVGVVARSLNTIKGSELTAVIKNIKLTAKYDDVKPGAVFTPADGADSVSRDSDFGVRFDAAITQITKEQIEISDGATVENAELSADGKELKLVFGNLKADTEYSVKLKEIKAVGAETAYDYDWTFKTELPVLFGKAYLVADRVTLLTEALGDIAETIKIPLKRSGREYTDSYLNGAYGSSYETVKYYSGNAFETEDGWLYAKQTKGQWESNRFGNLSKRITSELNNGESLELTAKVKLFKGGVIDGKSIDFHIGLTDDTYTQASGGSAVVPGSRLTLLRWSASSGGQYKLALGGINQEIRGTTDGKYAAAVTEPGYTDEELALTAVLSPMADPQNYSADIKLLRADGTVALSGVVSEGITKDMVLDYHNFDIESMVEWPNIDNQYRQLAIKDLKIEALKNTFKAGVNNIYVDYTNSDASEFSVKALAVIDKTENGVFVTEDAQLFDISGNDANGAAVLPVEIPNPDGRRVRVFILNSETGMVPLAAESIVQ